MSDRGGFDRRGFVRLLAAGGAAAAAWPSSARGQAQRLIRVDEILAIHFNAVFFVPRFLPPWIKWDFRKFAETGFGRLSAFMRGAIDAFGTSWNYLPQAVSEDVPLVAVTGIAGGGSKIVVQKDSGINSLRDLKGKKIALSEFISQDIMLIASMKKLGMDPFKDVTRVNVSPSGGVTAFQKREVDAFATFEPYASIAEVTGGGRALFDLYEHSGWGKALGGFYVRQAFAEANRDLVQAVVEAVIKASDYIQKNRDERVALAMKLTGQSREVIERAVTNTYPTLEMPLETIRGITRTMYEAGVIKKDVTSLLASHVDYSYLEKATGKKKEELGYSA